LIHKDVVQSVKSPAIEINKQCIKPCKVDLLKANDQALKDEDDNKSNLLSLPSNVTDDQIGISDIPIMKVSGSQSSLSSLSSVQPITANKPHGSAFVRIKLSLGKSKIQVDAKLNVDTGADMTLCDSAYLINHFGDSVIKHIVPMNNPPKLKSASGHYLKILGKVHLTLHLGEYKMRAHVLVHEGKSNVFLLGSDYFYDRLIFDRGLFLTFADKKYPKVPIQYELSKRTVKALTKYHVAPRSHALVKVKVTEDLQLIGKEIILSPIEDKDLSNVNNCDYHDCTVHGDPVRNTVSVIDSEGNAILLIQNETDDILTIEPDIEIANVDLI